MPLDRAIVLAFSAALLLVLVPTGTGVASVPSLESASLGTLRRPIELITAPAHLPVPETNVGIGPGAHLAIEIPGEGTFACTANFVWTSGGKTYLGAAGHCFVPQDKTATHGPGADYDASGVRVRVCVYGCSFGGQSGFILYGNEIELGRVAYARQTGPGGDIGNDFGVVEIPAEHLHRVRPTLPVWGGPTTSTPARVETSVCLYGNGVLVGESFATMARAGRGLEHSEASGRWLAALPANSGDSGGPLVTCAPAAHGGLHGVAPVGILTHGVGPLGVGVPSVAFGTTIAKAKAMGAQAGLDLQLVVA